MTRSELCLASVTTNEKFKMRAVFLLWHRQPLDGGVDENDTDDKLVGVYSSAAEADAARKRKLQFEGFRDYPDCFFVSGYEVDKDAWRRICPRNDGGMNVAPMSACGPTQIKVTVRRGGLPERNPPLAECATS